MCDTFSLILIQKIQQTQCVTYGTTGHLFRTYKVSLAAYTLICPSGDRTSDQRAETLPLSYWSTLHTSDAKLNPVFAGFKSKLNPVFASFSGQGYSIYIIPLVKKENIYLNFSNLIKLDHKKQIYSSFFLEMDFF